MKNLIVTKDQLAYGIVITIVALYFVGLFVRNEMVGTIAVLVLVFSIAGTVLLIVDSVG